MGVKISPGAHEQPRERRYRLAQRPALGHQAEVEFSSAREGQHTGHSYSNLLIHEVFGTKDRLPLLDSELKAELFPYMAGLIKKLGAQTVLINGPRDHIHALFILPARLSLSDMMEKLKANSSKWVHQRWPERRPFAWQEGYAAFSVSHSNLNRVKEYIENQEEHHVRRSFREELIVFLGQNQIAYDSRYVGP